MHVSAAGGIINAVKNAHNKGCEIFQFFDRSPRGGKPTYSDEDIIEFKKLAKGSNEVVRQDSAQIIPISRKFDPLKARSFFKPLS